MNSVTTRDRLIGAMGEALSRQGHQGVGLSQILAETGVQKGGLYHHFPDGKVELTVAAIEYKAGEMRKQLDALTSAVADPLEVIKAWLAKALQTLEESHYAKGCPLAAASLETGPEDLEIRASLASAFDALRKSLASMLEASGRVTDGAGLATLIISVYQGGLMQSRVANSRLPLQQSADLLFALLEAQWRATPRPTGGP